MAVGIYATLPAIAAAAFMTCMLIIGTQARDDRVSRHAWAVPAGFAAAFLAWSIFTVAVEGPTGFWRNHTANAWGNQIWFDLLFGIGCAYALVVPGAARLGMRPVPWLLAIACTGSVGLLAMMSRYLYLRERSART